MNFQVINAYAKSNEKLKAQKARSILSSMNPVNKADAYVEPNIYTFNAVLNACAYSIGDSEEKMNVFKIASRTFADLTQSKTCAPDAITYGTFLRCCSSLMRSGKERDSIVEAVFTRCMKEQKISDFVLTQVREAASKELYQKLRPWDVTREVKSSTSNSKKPWDQPSLNRPINITS
mmetsp:Transcript_14334/g.22103  ORF Transcript_14334/g.22103 Transcript_14334/m.22103 type:complete len:177 (-) Transcript_14334:78-608(-)